MVRILVVSLCFLVCSGTLRAADPMPAYDLLPASTQAVVWIRDSDTLANQWSRTQLAQLAEDSKIREFWQNQQQQIEDKLTSAGWRLHIQPRDLGGVVSGQLALAWVERKEDARKPFALVMIVDVIGKQKETEAFLQKLDNQLKDRKASRTQFKHAGVEIAQHTLPRQNGDILPQNTFYAVVNEQLLASDDQSTLQSLIDAATGKSTGEKLVNDPAFKDARKQLESDNQAQVEYFARPIGFARVLRAISGKPSTKNDVLTVLQGQGFEALRAVCGEIRLGEKNFDLIHKGFVLTSGPLKQLPASVQILDFPNEAKMLLPSWVSSRVSSMVSSCWNVREAFWKAEGLVDAMAGQPKVFQEIIEGIKVDPTGPRIDIRKDVMPLLTNEIYAVTDAKLPIDVDSRRNLFAVRLTDSVKMTKILNQAMATEVDAEELTINGQKIWQVVHKEDDLSLDLDQGFGNLPAATPAAGSGGPNPPLLSNWAISVYGDYLMFASHVEMITEAIEQAKQSANSPLEKENDYQRMSAALLFEFGQQPGCAWRINRSALAFRPQYELFRAGKLQDSESMLAKLLDYLLQNNTEMDDKKKKKNVVDGSTLPEFEKIAQYLQPSGAFVKSTESGWRFGSLLLAKDAQFPAPEKVAVQSDNAASKPSPAAPANR